MRVTRPLLLLFIAVATAAGGCARQPMIGYQMAAAPAPYGIDNVVYGSAPNSYAASGYGSVAAPAYAAAPTYPAARTYAASPAYASGPSYTAGPTYAAAPSYAAAPTYVAASAPGYAAVTAPSYGGAYGSPYGYAPTTQQPPYTLDSGDRLRIVVFGQEGLTNSYVLDASGDIAMPLIGSVAARGLTTDQLSARVAELLRQGYVRDPHVAVEIEAYRPFFILGEVTQPGQYPYVANMSVETAVAIAGGFGPRARRKSVVISRNYGGQTYRFETPTTAQVQPGDTIQVQERWF
ncbi:MAG: polysaccharide biosynthesis/export family protein [Xanthobacteraceae bacterium]